MIELTGFLLLVIFWLGFIPISLFAFKLSIDFGFQRNSFWKGLCFFLLLGGIGFGILFVNFVGFWIFPYNGNWSLDFLMLFSLVCSTLLFWGSLVKGIAQNGEWAGKVTLISLVISLTIVLIGMYGR